MSTGNIPKRWKELSGSSRWKGLLNPLDNDLRRYLVHYGQMAEATYDAFNFIPVSPNAGNSRYPMNEFFKRVGLEYKNPFPYKIVKFLYGTSTIGVPPSFIMKPTARSPWSAQTNWIGYMAVATDAGKRALGRRDILIAWRGTIQPLEWYKDFEAPLVSAATILGPLKNARSHQGFLSIYTSDNPYSRYSKISARQQVIDGLKQLMRQYKNEEISITVTGHSLGAALVTLCATDIAVNGFNKNSFANKNCPVTGFAYACPRTGDRGFKQVADSLPDLRILRITNVPDIVPKVPPLLIGYREIGEEFKIDTNRSLFLRTTQGFITWHNLEIYLHGIAGSKGSAEENDEFRSEIDRDISLVNKSLDALKDEYLVAPYWWQVSNKGMVQQEDGSWKIADGYKEEEEEVYKEEEEEEERGLNDMILC